MKNSNSRNLTQTSELLYKTINYRNNKFPLTTKNKHFSQKLSSKFFNLTLKEKISDEDDTKNNQNFKIFMDNLFKKDEDNNEISSIHSNKIFFGKEKNNYTNIINNYFSSRNQKNEKFLSKKINNIENKTYNSENVKNNEIEKRSIGSECNLINIFNGKRYKSRNFTFRKENSNFCSNTKNIQTFSFQEFDGKMLSKSKENNFFKKLDKIPKKHKKINSYNYIRKIIPKNLIPKIMFQASNILKRERENKMKLMAMKENAILFLKDKSNIMSNRIVEKKNLINSYGCTNEKTKLNLNQKFTSNISKFPLIKLKIYYNEKNLIKYMKKLDIKDLYQLKLAEIKNKKFSSDN